MKKSVLTIISLSLLATALSAQAQEAVDAAKPSEQSATTEAPKAAPSKKVEKIRVTGSRLKRVDTETSSQVQVFSKEEMEASGQTTLGDVLREIPSSIAGSTREESNRGAPGYSGVNLRGLGEKYTLVLIDGHRLPPDPAFDAVDVGAIPVAMIERVEILKEGASAIYGSDAVGGVVNIITRKSFDGSSVLFSHSRGIGKGGIENRIEAVTGKTYDHGSVVITGSYRKRDSIMSRDRDFIGEGWSSSGNPGSYVPMVADGVDANNEKIYKTKPGTVFAADPRCPTNDGTSRVFDTGNGVLCQYNYESVRSISPAITDKALMVKAEHEISDKIKTYGLVKYSKREAQDLIAPAPTGSGILITDAAAVTKIKTALESLKPGAGANIDPAAGDAVKIRYRTVSLGLRDTRTYDTSTLGVIGFSGAISDSWDYDASYTYGQIVREEKGVNGFWLSSKVNEAIGNGSFNPFDKNDSGAALADAEYTSVAKQGTLTRQANLTFSGPIAELPAGSVQTAIGASWVGEDFYSKADPELLAGNVEGSSGSEGRGKRQVKALYTEIQVPAAKDLEVNVAARLDLYDKYGKTFNPRLASKYKLNDVLFRASIGTGFRAPTLAEQNTQQSEGYPSFIDEVACDEAKKQGSADGIANYCAEQQYLYQQLPADSVKPEKVQVANLGFVYSPTVNHNLSVDYWFLKIKDTIGIPDLSLLTRAELKGDRGYEAKGIVITRDSETKELLSISSPATNLSATNVSGIDIATHTSYGSKSIATIDWSLETTYQLYYKSAAYEGQAMENIVGTARLPRWRATNTIGTDFLNDHRLALVARTTERTKKAYEALGKLPRLTSFDLNYTYNALLRGSLSIGAINVTNKQPPKDESANPTINFNLYSYAGRSYYLRLTQDF